MKFEAFLMYVFAGCLTGVILHATEVADNGSEAIVGGIFWPVFAIKYLGILLYNIFVIFIHLIGT